MINYGNPTPVDPAGPRCRAGRSQRPYRAGTSCSSPAERPFSRRSVRLITLGAVRADAWGRRASRSRSTRCASRRRARSTPCASRPRIHEHTVCVQTADPRAHRVRPDRGLGSTPCASRLVAVLISTGSIATELGTHRSVVCGLGYARAEMGEHATAICDLSTAAKPRMRPGCGCRAATATRRAVAHPRGASRSESNRPSGCSTTTCQRTREPDRIRSPIQTLRARAAGPAFAGRSEHAQLDYAHPTTRDQHARPATRDHHTHPATRDHHTRPHPRHK
jgi:hypothetical protein